MRGAVEPQISGASKSASADGSGSATVGGRNPAPPKKPWKDDSPRKYKQVLVSTMDSKWCEMDFVHPQLWILIKTCFSGTPTPF